MDGGPIAGQVLISPHLDDVALSAAVPLLRRPSHVVTVFAGLPQDTARLYWWDRLTGARDTRERMAERRAEDDSALSALGATTTRLAYLDRQFRDGEPVAADPIAADLKPLLRRASEVWLPAGIGGNTDHLAVRDAGLAALADLATPAAAPGGAEGAPATYLYADFPYVVKYGWGSRITGRPGRRYLDVDYWVEHEIARHGLDAPHLRPLVHRLDPEMRRQKLRAISAYRTQLPALGLDRPEGELLSLLEYELAWRLNTGG